MVPICRPGMPETAHRQELFLIDIVIIAGEIRINREYDVIDIIIRSYIYLSHHNETYILCSAFSGQYTGNLTYHCPFIIAIITACARIVSLSLIHI